MKKQLTSVIGGVAALSGICNAAIGQEVLPKPPAEFSGKIDIDRAKSQPAWPQTVKAPKGAPNVVVILLDDVGFGATSALGGPIQTPVLEALAAHGLRYNNFHVNAMCSPTRAALLTGRNSHQVGFGNITELAAGYPGYNTILPKSASTIAEVLRLNGYSTAAFGKWHNTPVGESGPTGPFDHWPTHLGFEYFYGFVRACDSQYEPRLFRDTIPVEPQATPQQGYHFTTDITNDAISWLHQHEAVTPDKPFFLYFATGATHAPLQVPQEWIAKFKGKFDQGWDKIREETFARQKAQGIIPANAELPARPQGQSAWDSLSREQQKLLAHQMEVYAAFLAHTDHEVGRLLQSLKNEGEADNTLVLYIAGDNGASLEGGPEGRDATTVGGKPETVTERLRVAAQEGSGEFWSAHAVGWGLAMDTPFSWGKQVASHLGGVTDPLIVSWPGHIADGGAVRAQFSFVTDIAPTIYEAAGIRAPDTVDGVRQIPLEGKSLLPSIADAKAPKAHRVQYFEMLGHRGIYKDGWWAGSPHLFPWDAAKRDEATAIADNPWQLYDLSKDFTQAHDLAGQNPEKLKELVTLFDSEAKRNQVYPLAPAWAPIPSPAAGRTHFVYREGAVRLPESVQPRFRSRPFTLTAQVNIADAKTEGVIATNGGRYGGFSLYVKGGKVIYESNAFGHSAGRVEAPLPLGKATFVVEQTPIGPNTDKSDVIFGTPRAAKAKLIINGKPAGEADIVNASAYLGETLDIGKDLGSPASSAYTVPFAFTGTLEAVTIDVQ